MAGGLVCTLDPPQKTIIIRCVQIWVHFYYITVQTRLPLFILPLFAQEQINIYVNLFNILNQDVCLNCAAIKILLPTKYVSDFSVFKCNLGFYFKVSRIF